jgi:hypothetical protein
MDFNTWKTYYEMDQSEIANQTLFRDADFPNDTTSLHWDAPYTEGGALGNYKWVRLN